MNPASDPKSPKFLHLILLIKYLSSLRFQSISIFSFLPDTQISNFFFSVSPKTFLLLCISFHFVLLKFLSAKLEFLYLRYALLVAYQVFILLFLTESDFVQVNGFLLLNSCKTNPPSLDLWLFHY